MRPINCRFIIIIIIKTQKTHCKAIRCVHKMCTLMCVCVSVCVCALQDVYSLMPEFDSQTLNFGSVKIYGLSQSRDSDVTCQRMSVIATRTCLDNGTRGSDENVYSNTTNVGIATGCRPVAL